MEHTSSSSAAAESEAAIQKASISEIPASASASAACTTADTSSDFTIAQTYQTIQQLIDVFQFTPKQAEDAVNAVGADITLAYNYVLDQGGEDKGGAILPKSDCEHIKDHVNFDICFDYKLNAVCNYVLEENSKGSGKGSFKSDVVDGHCPGGENWICLQCQAIRCSRYVNGHCEEHWRNTKASEIETTGDNSKAGHCIALSLNDLSVWCYECGAYLVNDDLTKLVQKFEHSKFGGDDVCIEVGGQMINSDTQRKESETSNKRPKCNDSGNLHHVIASDDCKNMSKEQSDHTYMTQSNTTAVELDHSKDSKNFQIDQMIACPMNENGDNESEKNQNSISDCERDEDSENGSNMEQIDRDISEDSRHYQAGDDSDMEKSDDECKTHPYLPTSMKDLAEFIKSDDCQSIVILAGAGMSRASGIPDFRSAGGLYQTLDPDVLTATESQRNQIKKDPSFVFDKHLFLENQLPCLECKRPFILGVNNQQWKATLAHRFVELLHDKTGKLTRLYTQNIDGLERQCENLPKELVIPVHGSMDRVACELEECQAEMDFEDFCEKMKTNIKDISGNDDSAPPTSTPIACEDCELFTVKPTVVLFHSPLPKIFFETIVKDLPSVDLFIVIGTSLTVGPANSLVYLVPDTCLRVIVNNEPVGYGLGIDYSDTAKRDYFARGYSDEVLLNLSIEMGWTEDIKGICDQLPDETKELIKSRLDEV